MDFYHVGKNDYTADNQNDDNRNNNKFSHFITPNLVENDISFTMISFLNQLQEVSI